MFRLSDEGIGQQLDSDAQMVASASLALEKMKQSTRNYANRQIRFVKRWSKMCYSGPSSSGAWMLTLNSSTYNLDEVVEEVVRFLDQVGLSNVDSSLPPLTLPSPTEAAIEWREFECVECQWTAFSSREWSIHLKSKRHKKTLKWLKNQESRTKWLEGRHDSHFISPCSSISLESDAVPPLSTD